MSENEEETPDSPSKVDNSPELNNPKESNQNPEATTQIVTSRSIAEDIISEMINIVFEAEDSMTVASSTQIVSNAVLTQNINKIHKQVFVKQKVQDDPDTE